MLSPGPIWLETIRFAETASSEENQMSIFPTKILLATDGSSEARLAARTAVELASLRCEIGRSCRILMPK